MSKQDMSLLLKLLVNFGWKPLNRNGRITDGEYFRSRNLILTAIDNLVVVRSSWLQRQRVVGPEQQVGSSCRQYFASTSMFEHKVETMGP